MITSDDYLQLNQMFKETLKDTLRDTLKEELKIAWETYSKDFQEFVIDHIQRLYEGQADIKLDINFVKADLGLVKADVALLKADVKRIDLRIKTRKKYD
jgi:hypothetical protein